MPPNSSNVTHGSSDEWTFSGIPEDTSTLFVQFKLPFIVILETVTFLAILECLIWLVYLFVNLITAIVLKILWSPGKRGGQIGL